MSFGFGFGFPRRLTSGGGLSPSLYLDFVGTGVLPSTVTFSRGTNATLTDSNGRVAWAPHNLLTNSEDFEAAAWTKTAAGIGVAPTVTANAGVAPDGTSTADRVQLSLGGGTTASDISSLAQTLTYTAADHTFSIWLRSNTGVDQTILLTNVNTQSSVITVTPVWQRFTWTVTATAISSSAGVRLRGTFTGGTADILVWGAQLNVANAPVNLLTWSEQFDNADWTKTALNTTGSPPWVNVAVAPDGTTTADKLIANNTSTQHFFRQNIAVAAGSYTMSVYAKAAEYSGLWMSMDGGSNYGLFTLSGAGSTSATAGTSTIAAVGNGWYLCTFTFTRAAGTAVLFFGSANPAGTLTFAGNGADGIFLWGAQLNTGSTALPYVATTSSIYLPPAYNSTTPKNLLGFTQEPENAAWTKSNSYVQQNLLLQSQDFATTWINSRTAVTVNTTAAPDGSITADTIAEDNQTGATGRSQAVSTVAGVSYTFSCFLKNIDRRYVQLMVYASANANYISAAFDLVAQTSTTAANGTGYSVTSASVVDVGNGWFRCSITGVVGTTPAGAAAISPRPDATAGGFPNYAGTTLAFYAWGAQLVQGSTAGDYTQTTSAAAPTRYLNWDGTLTGRKLVEDTANSQHAVVVASGSRPTIAAGLHTEFVYLKAGERTSAAVYNNGTSGGAGVAVNLLTGAVIDTGGAQYVSNTIQSVGGGWYKVGLTFLSLGGTSGLTVYLGNTFAGQTYTGDGTSGIYVSDFQLSNSASVDPYVYNPQAAAASAAYYGPRFDYNPTGSPIPSGVELVTNGTFNSASGWSTGGAWVISGGAASITAGTAALSQSTLAAVAGRTYQVTFTISSFSSGGVRFEFGGINGASRSAAGTYTQYITTSSTAFLVISPTATSTLSIDNVSVQEVTGYTATANGLLIEEQRTNLILYGEDFSNALWAKSNTSISANTAVAPDGATTADSLIEDTATSQHGTSQIFTGGVANTTYTFSVFLKQNTRTKAQIAITDNATGDANTVADLVAGTVTAASVSGNWSSPVATIQPASNGYYRVALTVTKSAIGNTSVVPIIRLYTTSNTYTGDGTSGIFIWGAQLEAGSFATSYIPTVASQVTRNADSASMLGDNFYTWFNVNQGTVSSEFDVAATTAGGGMSVVSIATASTNGYLLYKGLSAAGLFAYTDGNSASLGNLTVNTVAKAAIAYNGISNAGVLNGAPPAAITPVAVTPPTLMYVGRSYSGTQLSGHIRRISYYNTRLPDSTLQALTV